MITQVTIEIEYGEDFNFIDEFVVDSTDEDCPEDMGIDCVHVKRHGSEEWEESSECHLLERYAEYMEYENLTLADVKFKHQVKTAMKQAEDSIVYLIQEQAAEEGVINAEEHAIQKYEDREFDKYEAMDRDYGEYGPDINDF